MLKLIPPTGVYQCFSIPSGLLADKYITSFEAIPGNPACVHHVLVFADTTGTCAHLDSLSPGPGYPDFGGVGSSSATMIGAWVPGSSPMVYPNGFGVRIAHSSDVVLQIHYPAGTVGMTDSTEIHFFFAPTTASIRNVYIEPVLNYYSNIDTSLFIAANTTRSFNENMTSPLDITLIGMAPHMHLLGQNIKCYGVHAAGDTDKYISVPKWDFHWQGFYTLPQLKKIPAGTHVRAEAYYDNTTANPENPHSPPENVSAGENTTDEMMLVYFVFTNYQPGDENIIIDSAVALSTPQQYNDYYHGQQLLDVCRNPTVNDLVVKCYLDEADKASIDLVDVQGKVVKHFMEDQNIAQGYNAFTYTVTGVPPGTYTVRMQTRQRILSQKIMVVH